MNRCPPTTTSLGEFEYQPLAVTIDELQAKALQNRPDLRAAVLGVTAANSQYALAKANGKQDPTISANYSHANGISGATWSFSIPLAIFDRNQGNIAQTRIAIRQAEEQQKAASGQVLTDVKDAYEGLQESARVAQLYKSTYLDVAQKKPRHQRIRLPARRYGAAGFPGRRAQLSRHRTRLPPSGGGLLDGIGAASPGSGNQGVTLIQTMKKAEVRARIEEIGIIPGIRVSTPEDALFRRGSGQRERHSHCGSHHDRAGRRRCDFQLTGITRTLWWARARCSASTRRAAAWMRAPRS